VPQAPTLGPGNDQLLPPALNSLKNCPRPLQSIFAFVDFRAPSFPLFSAERVGCQHTFCLHNCRKSSMFGQKFAKLSLFRYRGIFARLVLKLRLATAGGAGPGVRKLGAPEPALSPSKCAASAAFFGTDPVATSGLVTIRALAGKRCAGESWGLETVIRSVPTTR
jgi:hypothetical protein